PMGKGADCGACCSLLYRISALCMGAPVEGYCLQRRLVEFSTKMQKIKDCHEQQHKWTGACEDEGKEVAREVRLRDDDAAREQDPDGGEDVAVDHDCR